MSEFRDLFTQELLFTSEFTESCEESHGVGLLVTDRTDFTYEFGLLPLELSSKQFVQRLKAYLQRLRAHMKSTGADMGPFKESAQHFAEHLIGSYRTLECFQGPSQHPDGMVVCRKWSSDGLRSSWYFWKDGLTEHEATAPVEEPAPAAPAEACSALLACLLFNHLLAVCAAASPLLDAVVAG